MRWAWTSVDVSIALDKFVALWNQRGKLLEGALSGKQNDMLIISPEDFGGRGDGRNADDQAFLSAVSVIQANGGGTFRGIPGKTYKLTPAISASLLTLTSLNGVTIDFRDSLLSDAQSYTGANGQFATLFKFVGCRNINIYSRVASQIAVTTSGGTTHARGLIPFQLTQGCRNVNVDLDVTGCLMGLNPTRAYNDPESYRSKQIRGRITATGCYYPYAGQFSGDDCELSIDSDTCGRSFYIYGNSNQRLNVHAKNQQVTSLIWAFNGYGCRDVNLVFVDRDSDSNQAAAPRVQLGWGDSTAAAHAGIDLRFDVANPGGLPFGSTFEFVKYSDGSPTPDVTGRGHLLDGFKLSGYSSQVAGVNHVTMGAGAFVAPDSCRNVKVENFTGLGSTSAVSFGATTPLSQLSGRAVFENVSSEHNILAYNGANGEVVFLGCNALNFSGSTADTDTHTLVGCAATDGTSQSITNKSFVACNVAGYSTNYTHLRGQVDLPVVATASLPAAATARNGSTLIEDAGAGDRNLIIYAGAQRFRIDGGAAF